jgi:hypothetical protein
MRLLLEIIVVAALLALSWEKSFKQRVSEVPWLGDKIAPIAKAPAQSQQHPKVQPHSIVTPAPTTSGAWMWDPSHKSPLDPPKKHAEPTPH